MINFGTSGFRAVIGEEFNKVNVQKIAQALSKIIKRDKLTKPVVIGYDKRFMSDYYAREFAEVLAGNKIKTLLYSKSVTTPQVAFTIKDLELDFGIIITASHNPYIYNGIKLFVKGGKDAPIEVTNEVEKFANSKTKIKTLDYETATKNELIMPIDNLKEYIKNLDKFVSKNLKGSKIKILYNAMHGATPECTRAFAKHYKLAKFDIINDEEDAYFGHVAPCPNGASLEQFKKQVVKGRYAVGFACDVDGDRLGIIDDLGNYVDNNIIMGIIYYYLVKIRGLKGDVVKNYSTTILLDKLSEKFGFKTHETFVGFKHTARVMKETDALLGGESSGGLTVRNYTPFKDGLFSISQIVDALAYFKKPLSEVIKEVKSFAEYYHTYYEDTLKLKDRNKFLKLLMKKSPTFSYKPINKIVNDGMKYVFEDGSWVNIRLSGTENIARYHVEFPTEIECERNIKAIKKFVDDFNKK